MSKLSIRDLPLSTCLVYINISEARSFPSFIYNFIYICFGFDETKLTKWKLYGELWAVLQYNFKELQEFSECRFKYGSVESAD